MKSPPKAKLPYRSPRETALRKFKNRLKEHGLNFSGDVLEKLYDIQIKEAPRWRSKALPSRGTLDRLEITGYDQYGQKIQMEAGKSELMQRQRRKKRQWNTIANTSTKHGTFSLKQHVSKPIFGISYNGGMHSDFLVINESWRYLLEKYLGEGNKSS